MCIVSMARCDAFDINADEFAGSLGATISSISQLQKTDRGDNYSNNESNAVIGTIKHGIPTL